MDTSLKNEPNFRLNDNKLQTLFFPFISHEKKKSFFFYKEERISPLFVAKNIEQWHIVEPFSIISII